MTIDIELLLAWHPFLFLWWECGIERFHCSDVLTAIGGGRRNIHPLFVVESTRDKLADKKCSREITVYDIADVLLFAAHESTSVMWYLKKWC